MTAQQGYAILTFVGGLDTQWARYEVRAVSDLDKIKVAAADAAARIVAGCEHTLIDDGDDWITGAYAGAACEHCVEAALVNFYQGVMRAKAQKTNEDFERERDNVFKYPSDH